MTASGRGRQQSAIPVNSLTQKTPTHAFSCSPNRDTHNPHRENPSSSSGWCKCRHDGPTFSISSEGNINSSIGLAFSRYALSISDFAAISRSNGGEQYRLRRPLCVRHVAKTISVDGERPLGNSADFVSADGIDSTGNGSPNTSCLGPGTNRMSFTKSMTGNTSACPVVILMGRIESQQTERADCGTCNEGT